MTWRAEALLMSINMYHVLIHKPVRSIGLGHTRPMNRIGPRVIARTGDIIHTSCFKKERNFLGLMVARPNYFWVFLLQIFLI